MPLPFILAAAAVASSLISDATKRSDAQKAKSDAIIAFEKLLIPENEIRRTADSRGDLIYTQTMQELNNGAFAFRGSLNPEVLKTIAFAKMAGLRAATELESEQRDIDYNRGVKGQIAGIKSQPIPSINPADAVGAGIEGYIAGEQINMSKELVDKQKEFYNVMIEDLDRAGGTSNLFGNISPIAPNSSSPDALNIEQYIFQRKRQNASALSMKNKFPITDRGRT